MSNSYKAIWRYMMLGIGMITEWIFKEECDKNFNDQNILKSERWVYYGFAPILLLYSLFLTIFSQSGFPKIDHAYFFMPYVSDKLIGEDGYYMLGVAWNIALGKGITYNFGDATTGIQPLATFLYAGIAKVVQFFEGDKFVFARSTFFFNTLLFIYFAHLIGRLSLRLNVDLDRRALYLLAFSMSLFNLVLFKHFTYGLETGLYLTLFLLTILFSLTHSLDNVKNRIILGFLVGLTGLARIDFGVIACVFFLLKLKADKKFFWPLVLVGVVAIITVSPWFLYVHQVTQHWIPSSGGAQASMVNSFAVLIDREFQMLNSLGDNGIAFIYGAKLSLSLFAVFVSMIGIYLANKNQIFYGLPKDYQYWLYGVLLIIILYVVFFWASHFYTRYSAPIVLFAIPFFQC